MHIPELNRPWTWIGAWLLLTASAVLFWPLLPIDETRYVAVAWEMFNRGDFLVPHMNGAPYSHKPPLLFWLIDAGWWLFGVNDIWPRLVPSAFGLGSLFVTRAIARQLWPQRPRLAELAPFMVLGAVFWTLFTPAIMFDLIMSFWTGIGLLGGILALRGSPARGFLMLTLGLGLGLLSKGPVIYLYVLPALLLAPWWHQDRGQSWYHWYLTLLAAVIAAACIALTWALPAALQGGEAFAEAILWGQTSGRIVASFAHARPWWWYLPLLPVLLFPWLFWPTLWRAVGQLWRNPDRDAGLRFSLSWLLPPLLALSLVSGKQPHYLLPLFPAIGLLLARALDGVSESSRRPWPVGLAILALACTLFLLTRGHLPENPSWSGEIPAWSWILLSVLGLVILTSPVFRRGPASVPYLFIVSITLGLTFSGAIMNTARGVYDTRPLALLISRLQAGGARVAFLGKYQAQFTFNGRLTAPLQPVKSGDIHAWASQHPQAYVVGKPGYETSEYPPPLYLAPYRGKQIGLWPAQSFQLAERNGT